jgi:uncharacterized protein YndB with AHSA1/START domain
VREGGGDVLGRIEKSIEIRASPEKVWEMLALDRWSEWQVVGGIGSMQIEKGVRFTSEVNTPEDKYRVGASAQPTTYDKLTFKVTESLKNEKITYLIEEPGRNSTITYILEPVEAGIKLTHLVGYEMPWGIFGKFLEKAFAKRMGEGQLEKSLEKLKSILEKERLTLRQRS